MSFFNRAAATANRLMRTQQVEMAITNLRDQQKRLASEIATKALELYHSGKLTEPEFLPSFQAWDALEQQIAQRESEKKAIEAEGTPAAVQPQSGPAPAQQAYGHLCSKERIPVPAGAAFCPRCGAPAVDVAPPAPPAPSPAQASGTTCAACGAAVPAGSGFCPQCGAAQPKPAA